MLKLGFWVLVLFASYLGLIGATRCLPRSTFKVDCNTCTCSSSGLTYSCEQKNCGKLNYEEKYETVTLANGHVLLKPRRQRSFNSEHLKVPSNIRNGRIYRKSYKKVDDKIPKIKRSDDKEDIFDDWINNYKESTKENSFVKKNAFLTSSRFLNKADSTSEVKKYRPIDEEDDEDYLDSLEQSGNGIDDTPENPNWKEWKPENLKISYYKTAQKKSK